MAVEPEVETSAPEPPWWGTRERTATRDRLSRDAMPATGFLGIPPDRMVEPGSRQAYAGATGRPSV